MTDTHKDQLNSGLDKAKEAVGGQPRSATEQAADKTHDAANKAGNKLGEISNNAQGAAQDAGSQGQGYLSQAAGLVGNVAGGVQSRAVDLKDAALGHGSNAQKTAEEYASKAQQEAGKAGQEGKGYVASAVDLAGGAVTAVKDRTFDAVDAVLGSGSSAKAQEVVDNTLEAGQNLAGDAKAKAVGAKDAVLGKK